MDYIIKKGNVITDGKIFFDTDVIVKDGKIFDITPSGSRQYQGYTAIDALGMYVSPGFVDIHQHGGGGSEYMDLDPHAFKISLYTHLIHGTTSVMPTLLSSDSKSILSSIDRYADAQNDKTIKSNLLGIHIEGPYLSPAQSGAQNTDQIRHFDQKEYTTIIRHGNGRIKRWSVAPELEGVEKFASAAADNGIALSIAHSDADFDTVCHAYDLGFHHVTHFYSCTGTVIRKKGFRIAGVVEAAYFLDGMRVEIIADGCHLPQSLIKLIVKLKGKNNVALITDAMRAAGQNVSKSFIGSGNFAIPVIVEDGVAKLESREAFAGSIATSDILIRTMLACGYSIADCVRMVTEIPLSEMELKDKKGRIAKGYDADICIFDKKVNIKNVFVNGELVYK